MADEAAPPPYAEKMSASDEPSGEPPGREKQHIIVLVIGETQNGKSTMIRQLGVYGGKPNLNIKIGLGNSSCTKNVSSYPFDTALRSYHLQDAKGRKIKNVKYSDLVDYTDDDATVAANKPDHDGKQFTFQFVDTPGLDDSDGNDMDIMTEILGKIGTLPHLNAVIYVRNLNRPFGTSFKTIYEYISRCMPSVSNGLIVCHTGFSVDVIDQAQSQKRDLMRERLEAFRKASGRSLDLAHFFMDNEPNEDAPFAIMESFNACYSLLTLLSTQLPLDTKHLKLLKTPVMRQKDVHVQLRLERLHESLKKRLSEHIDAANKSKQQVLRTKVEVARLRSKLEDISQRMEELNNSSTIVLGTKHVSEDFGLKNILFEGTLWLEEQEVTFDSEYTISHVEKSATGGSRWGKEDLRGTTWRAKLSASVLRSINGSATFYTTSRTKHAREIDLLKGNKAGTLDSISFHEESINTLSAAQDSALSAKEKKLVETGESCGQILEKVKAETFDVLLWPLLKSFYTSMKMPSNGDVVEFISVHDPELARLCYEPF